MMAAASAAVLALDATTPSRLPLMLAPQSHAAGEETRSAVLGACSAGEPPHAPTPRRRESSLPYVNPPLMNRALRPLSAPCRAVPKHTSSANHSTPQRIQHDVLRCPRKEARAHEGGSSEGNNVSQAALEPNLVARALLQCGMMRPEPVNNSYFTVRNDDLVLSTNSTGKLWPEQGRPPFHEPPRVPPSLETPPEPFPSGTNIDDVTRLLAVCITAALWLRLVLDHQAVMGRARRARVVRARNAPSSAAKRRRRVRARRDAEVLRNGNNGCHERSAATSDGRSKKRVSRGGTLLPQWLLLLLVLSQCLCGTRADELAHLKDDEPVHNPPPDDIFHAGFQNVAPPPPPSASREANPLETTSVRRELQSSYVFTTTAALRAARDAWCANPTSAAVTYGAINTWDVSRITDMTQLFCTYLGHSAAGGHPTHYCNGACTNRNFDIADWDVSSVTDMRVCRLSLTPSSLLPRPLSLCPDHRCLWLFRICSTATRITSQASTAISAGGTHRR